MITIKNLLHPNDMYPFSDLRDFEILPNAVTGVKHNSSIKWYHISLNSPLHNLVPCTIEPRVGIEYEMGVTTYLAGASSDMRVSENLLPMFKDTITSGFNTALNIGNELIIQVLR